MMKESVWLWLCLVAAYTQPPTCSRARMLHSHGAAAPAAAATTAAAAMHTHVAPYYPYLDCGLVLCLALTARVSNKQHTSPAG